MRQCMQLEVDRVRELGCQLEVARNKAAQSAMASAPRGRADWYFHASAFYAGGKGDTHDGCEVTEYVLPVSLCALQW